MNPPDAWIDTPKAIVFLIAQFIESDTKIK